MPEWTLPEGFTPHTRVSVLIPARNEEENILPCVHSILEQIYPAELLEIIVIDDHSDDNTAAVVENLRHPQVRVLKLSDFPIDPKRQSFKKMAIETGIAQAKGELIVTTDADCSAGPIWLSLLVSLYETKRPKFIAAPVNFYREKNLLQRFQSLDFLGMMAVTGAGIYRRFMHMCNGANLAYEKSAFYEVNGFQGIDHLASGDDMLLMQKIAQRYPDRIAYLKNRQATVFTEAKPDWRSFLQQRIRWATKSSQYREWQVIAILSVVFFFCCNIVLTLLLSPFFPYCFGLFCAQFLLKGAADYVFLGTMCRYFDKKDLMSSFLPSLFLHIAYIVGVGFLGNVVKQYEWKGRKVK